MVTNSTTDPSTASCTNDYRNWFDREEEESQSDKHENFHAGGGKLLTESSDVNQIWKSNPFFDQHEQIGPQENFIRCHLDKDYLNIPAAIGYGQENQFYNTTQAYQESNQLPHHHPQMNQFPQLEDDRLRPVQRYDAQTPYDPLDSVDPDPPIMVGEKPPEAPPAPSISFLPPPILPNPSNYPPAPVPPPYPPQWSNHASVVVGTNHVSGQILWVNIY